MPFASDKKRVAVLRGGPSPEYEVSLNTGKSILQNLGEEYQPIDVIISKEGAWHEAGFEKRPENILRRVDLVINGLHGSYGEDGTVQKLLEDFRVPYTGSDSISSALAMNKIMAKKVYEKNGLKTPVSINIPFEKLTRETIRQVYQSLPAPYVVKPSSAGSSVGVYIARSFPELEEAIVASSKYSPEVLVEEFITGKEATCGVVDGFRGEEYYPLLPIEIRHKKDFLDYDSKYVDDTTEVIIPGNFSKEETDLIKRISVDAHKALGLRHYSRSDFIVHPKRGIYILETNSLPGLTDHSFIPKSLHAIGSNIKEFLSHLIGKVLKK